MIPPDPEEIPTKISSNPKFSPFFVDCIYSIDGSHILAVVKENEQQTSNNYNRILFCL